MNIGNRVLAIAFNETAGIGGISLVNKRLSVSFREEIVSVYTDGPDFHSNKEKPSKITTGETGAEFYYDMPSFELVMAYAPGETGAFLERCIQIRPKRDLMLYRIVQHIDLTDEPEEVINYHTFWNCPTAIFVRLGKTGFYCGFANPFFSMTRDRDRLSVFFEPQMLVKKEECYISEPNFIGIHEINGPLIRQEIPKTALMYNGADHPRYRNPSGYIPLYRSETGSFKKYADHYLELRVKEFKFIFYQFFSPLPQQPKNEEEEQLYYHYIDNFSRLGGDIITFNPLVRNQVPRPDKEGFWELAPAGSAAERILQYTKSKGIKIGIYMGSAPDNSNYCNSAMTEFASTREKPYWKKTGLCGEISRENCIASDDFADWFFQVQKNTIDKYGITLWDWDPGPGNGFFCYSTVHGHVPGRGGYKGFRNAMTVIKRLRETFPELYIQGFHGTKEYGLWGFKGFDQHEAYWEQCPYDMATLYPDLSEDRLTASGMRFQSWWNQNFRFMPAIINHSLAHRMTQSCMSPRELLYLFDHLGYKYAVMSALAAGASLTAPLIPYDMDDIYGSYTAFYHKWIQWGRENFSYNKNAVAFGDQARAGGIDGYAKIINDKGFIFLCNPAPVPASISFELGEETGLYEPGSYTLKEIYPRENVLRHDEKNGSLHFEYGSTLDITVPQYEILLLKLEPKTESRCELSGITGNVTLVNGKAVVEGSVDLEGEIRQGILHIPPGYAVKELIINKTPIAFEKKNGKLHFTIRYGESVFPRYLYDWYDDENRPYPCPNVQPEKHVVIETNFTASNAMKHLLEKARPKNVDQIEKIIDKLVEEGRGNFAWAVPHRLFLVLPFMDSSRVKGAVLAINGKPCNLTCVSVQHNGNVTTLIRYADITDTIQFDGKNTLRLEITGLPSNYFIGAYLYYPSAPESTRVQSASNTEMKPVVVSGRLWPCRDLKPWYMSGEKQIRINSAWIQGDLVEEFKSFTVCAEVNYAPEGLEGVYCSAQICIDETGNSLHADEKLEYDGIRKRWFRTLNMGNRHLLIIDGEYIHLWAVTKDGYVSPTYRLKINWKLP